MKLRTIITLVAAIAFPPVFPILFFALNED